MLKRTVLATTLSTTDVLKQTIMNTSHSRHAETQRFRLWPLPAMLEVSKLIRFSYNHSVISVSLHFVPFYFVPGHFFPVTLSPGHFVPGHFVPGHFVPRSLCLPVTFRVFNDLICDFTKSDFKSFSDDLIWLKINFKNSDLIWDLILRKKYKSKSSGF
jgi:hypothetical protein